jgi:aspartate/methionine/tyrosine aminotransferase
MYWAKTRPAARFDLAISNVLACSIDDLPGAADALALTGDNDNGYGPLVESIAERYGVTADHVTTAQGTSGANFLVCAALLSPGDDVLMERPGYDPLMAAARLLRANVVRYDRAFEDGYRLDPQRVADAMTPRTKLVIVTSPHNPTGAIANPADLQEVGRIAAGRGAQVLVDEVYLDSTGTATPPAARQGDPFISTSSLTKSYGLSGLRCGWILSSPGLAERLRRARDVVDGTARSSPNV